MSQSARPLPCFMKLAKLTPSDFRFVSAWVQGVDVQDAWHRYQTHRGEGDLRRIRSTARTILDELAAVAKRHGDAHASALLRRDPLSIRSGRAAGVRAIPAMPTLEEFSATLRDADFYSERELVALLEERYGRVASLRPGQGAHVSARRLSFVPPSAGRVSWRANWTLCADSRPSPQRDLFPLIRRAPGWMPGCASGCRRRVS